MVRKRLDLEEIGRLAGVSRSTVSRVVNGEPNVSDAAKARVAAVIEETGYRPHAAARSLASSKTGVVGLVIPSAVETLFDDPYFGRLILGITQATNALGKTLSLFLFKEPAEEESIFPRVVGPGLVDGVIVTANRMRDPLIERLFDAGMPFVVVGRLDEPRPAFSVDVDNRGGARLAAAHLAGLGYRRIGMIGAPLYTSAGVDRRDGFVAGLADAGLEIGSRFVEGDWSQRSGMDAMSQLLAQEPDAVFVGSDRMAIGAIRAIGEVGLRCPDDVAVVSFDGIIPVDQTAPRLTSIVQPVTAVGERSLRLLQSVIDGSTVTPEQIIFPTELAVRESCGATLTEGRVPV